MNDVEQWIIYDGTVKTCAVVISRRVMDRLVVIVLMMDLKEHHCLSRTDFEVPHDRRATRMLLRKRTDCGRLARNRDHDEIFSL